MSLLDKIKTEIGKIGHAIAGAFIAIFGSDLAREFAGVAERMLATEAGKIVLTVVQQIQGSMPTASITQKVETFYLNVAPAIKSAGIELSDSLLGLLREIGVQKLKGTLDKLAIAGK